MSWLCQCTTDRDDDTSTWESPALVQVERTLGTEEPTAGQLQNQLCVLGSDVLAVRSDLRDMSDQLAEVQAELRVVKGLQNSSEVKLRAMRTSMVREVMGTLALHLKDEVAQAIAGQALAAQEAAANADAGAAALDELRDSLRSEVAAVVASQLKQEVTQAVAQAVALQKATSEQSTWGKQRVHDQLDDLRAWMNHEMTVPIARQVKEEVALANTQPSAAEGPSGRDHSDSAEPCAEDACTQEAVAIVEQRLSAAERALARLTREVIGEDFDAPLGDVSPTPCLDVTLSSVSACTRSGTADSVELRLGKVEEAVSRLTYELVGAEQPATPRSASSVSA